MAGPGEPARSRLHPRAARPGGRAEAAARLADRRLEGVGVPPVRSHGAHRNRGPAGQGDAAVVRFTGQRDGGVALSVDCNSRYCYLGPRLGAAHAVAEASRNVSCVGGEPLAITDCLNVGNPERPDIMWQFEQACLGIADACTALGTPVVSGNVSLYNETEGKGIFPTPTIGMVGLMEDCGRNAVTAFLAAGERIALLGRPAGPQGGHLGGSEYLKAVHG